MKNKLIFVEDERTYKTIKVLAIGNSFSEDATTYLRNMALADGVDLRVGNHWIGGCALERHYRNITNGKAHYTMVYYTPEVVYTADPTTLDDGLLASDWDFVTIQQVSNFSGRYETFEPYATELVSHIKKHLPKAEILLHMTWAYPESEEGMLALKDRGYTSQLEMYENIKKAYAQFAKDQGNARVLPTGEAIQRARATKMGDDFSRDNIHCNKKGRLVAGWVWYQTFTGISPFESKFDAKTVCDLTDEEIELMKKAAYDAYMEYNK